MKARTVAAVRCQRCARARERMPRWAARPLERLEQKLAKRRAKQEAQP